MAVHVETGCAVFCAFSAGNLSNVTEYLLKTHSNKNIIIAADNDQWKNSGNTGLLSALEFITASV